MPAVRSIKNQYLGVNAHQHSFWHTTNSWNRFHKIHVAHLMIDLRTQLRPLGYTAHLERSLQIEKNGTQLNAIAIYEYPAVSRIITWIELHAANKRRGQSYRAARLRYLQQETVFVDLNYLHETPPTFDRLPDYTLNRPSAHAYHIVIIDPRPTLDDGKAMIYSFDVDARIPTLKIPLNRSDMLPFDFGATYQHTFEHALFGYNVDYTKFPMDFERYSHDDQTRIARRMLAVLKAQRAGGDLENTPCPLEELSLDEALAQIASLTA